MTKAQLEKYRDILLGLPLIEKELVDGGLIFANETLTYYSVDFLDGRIARVTSLIDSGRY